MIISKIKRGFLGSNQPLELWEKVMVWGSVLICIKATVYGYIFLKPF
jgi:hypothetical protein